MNDICVYAENLSKRFIVVNRKGSVLQTLKAFIKRETLRWEHWVLRDVSFDIRKGDKVAIVGRNGAGKTTLLRILTGIYDKTTGHFETRINPSALFKFWIGLNGELSVIDNIYLFGAVHGMGRDFLKNKIDEILQMVELKRLAFSPLRSLSAGQIQRLALSVFFQTPSDFLIFDESLMFIDQGFVQKCDIYFKDLYASEKTVIMASHNSSFLKKYCKTAIWLDEGCIRMRGKTDEVITRYEESFKL